MNSKKSPRSPCPLANGLDIFGDRWSLLIMRDLIMSGKKRYGDFLKSPEGIPTNILAERLRRLEREGLIEKRLYTEHPPRYEYLPTKKGWGVEPIMQSIVKWARTHLKD